MNQLNPKVDDYLDKMGKWREESLELRRIILDSHLTEDFKWRLPCYTLDNNNIVIIQSFKDYCAVMFFKGALLKDSEGVLVQPGKTQAGRQIRFTSVKEIIDQESILRAYIQEAIGVETAGLQVKLKKTEEFKVPEEFQSKLDEDSDLKNAFEALTPGRQRAYIYYFSSAKQSKTRQARVDRCLPKILRGQGLNDP